MKPQGRRSNQSRSSMKAGSARLEMNLQPFRTAPTFLPPRPKRCRRILIERARRRQAVHRGGGQQRVELEQVQLPFPSDDDQLLAVNEALQRLAALHPEEAEVVKLGYFAGLTHEEAAQAPAFPCARRRTTGLTPMPGCSRRSAGRQTRINLWSSCVNSPAI